jgi:hypothetical protein
MRGGSTAGCNRYQRLMILGFLLTFLPGTAVLSQTGGEGAIQGTVTDQSGALVGNATVTATNAATGVSTTRTTTSDGLYEISPILPGTYVITVTAQGFRTFKQENLVINAMKVTGFNASLSIGSATQEVTVTAAPPALDTTNATLGGVIENKTYSQLPILMNGAQRDPTAFATLLPGAQAGSRIPVFSGTGNYLGEMYLEGVPMTTANQQGDNRNVSYALPFDSIDQLQAQTSGVSAEYQGAGLENFTIKSGTNQLHGSVADFVRNTIFDTWGYTAKAATVTNAAGMTVPAPKPAEHQNELDVSVGGPIFHDKLFFFGAYQRYQRTSGVNPGLLTVPTVAMRNGDFSQLLASNGGPGIAVYDPSTQAACTANSTNGPCRYQYGYGPGGTPGSAGNPVPTGVPVNVIPANQLSPITQYLQKFLPAPSNGAIVNNYLGGVPSGYNNWTYLGRIDYDISSKQRLSALIDGGSRESVPFNVNATTTFPIPYTNGQSVDLGFHIATLEDSYVITPNLVNQFKFGFVNFGGPPAKSLTQGISQYEITTAGVTGLPAGQASDEFPQVSFSGTDAQTNWLSGGVNQGTSTYTAVSENYTLVDNLQWVKGKHSMSFGFQYQWLEANISNYDTGSYPLVMSFSQSETAAVTPTSSSNPAAKFGSGGYSYASYLLGAINSSGVTIQPFSVLGGRYHPFAPYFQDDYKVNEKLTLNLGLRWDYLPPYHEVDDRWSFLNPNLTNGITGNKGELQFAGSRGPASCNCQTPVHTYWGNWGPRIGLAYSVNDKTVIRGAYGLIYSHGGGVGGRGGAYQGTGQLGFQQSPAFGDTPGGPAAFYLNNSAYYQTIGMANTNFGGPGFTLPALTPPSAALQTLNTGNYVTSSGAYVQPSSAPGYADPYLSGRAPSFDFFNFGIQRAITSDLTATASYVGSQSHFLAASAGNARGYWANQLDPRYLALGSLLSSPATAANVAAAQAIIPGVALPYPGYETAAAHSSKATIAQMLTAFPQYSSVADTWGNVANANYNALQISVSQRQRHGFSATVNYTYAKQLDDAGTFRSGFDIPGSVLASGTSWKRDRIERAISTIDQPQNLAAYGVYQLPFGKGGIGRDNFLVRALASGWQLSSIFTYRSGNPLALVASNSNCTNTPGQGQCMPNYNPSFSGAARQNGSWGHGVTSKTLGSVQYISPTALQDAPEYTLGDVARTRADNLWAPSSYDIDASVRRTFDITERWKFIFEADVTDLTNKVTFGGIGVNVDSGFGAITSASGNRDWQFAGRINF